MKNINVQYWTLKFNICNIKVTVAKPPFKRLSLLQYWKCHCPVKPRWNRFFFSSSKGRITGAVSLHVRLCLVRQWMCWSRPSLCLSFCSQVVLMVPDSVLIALLPPTVSICPWPFFNNFLTFDILVLVKQKRNGFHVNMLMMIKKRIKNINHIHSWFDFLQLCCCLVNRPITVLQQVEWFAIVMVVQQATPVLWFWHRCHRADERTSEKEIII